MEPNHEPYNEPYIWYRLREVRTLSFPNSTHLQNDDSLTHTEWIRLSSMQRER